jgi:hypothetical protein
MEMEKVDQAMFFLTSTFLFLFPFYIERTKVLCFVKFLFASPMGTSMGVTAMDILCKVSILTNPYPWVVSIIGNIILLFNGSHPTLEKYMKHLN